MDLKIVIKRKHFGIIWVFIAFILPYTGISVIRQMFEVRLENISVPAVFPIMLALWAWLFLGNRIRRYHKTAPCRGHLLRVDIMVGLLMLFAIFVLLFEENDISNYIQVAMFYLPYLFARELLLRIQGTGLTEAETVKYGTIFFVLSQLGFLLVNVVVYGFSFDGSEESRILSVGGGPVILGYTISLVLACWVLFAKHMSKRMNIFVVASCVLLALATGSRGSMWPVLALMLMFFASKNGKISLVRCAVLALLGALVLLLVDLQSLFPRLFLTEEGGRFSSITANLKAFETFSFIESLFGKGIGNFFPIQLWNIDNSGRGFLNYNQFSYEGILLLVQPHNSFIYALMEMGLVGLLIYTVTLKHAVGYSLLRRKSHSLAYNMFLVVAFLVLLLESTFFVETGSASLWWFVLLLVGSSRRNSMSDPAEKENSLAY